MSSTALLSRRVSQGSQPATVRIGQCDYGSHFQPIATRQGRVIAHEALLRPVVGDALGASIQIATVFPAGLPHGEFVVRDQQVRLLHCINFSRAGHGGKLFLNTHSRAFVECAKNGDFSSDVCRELGLEPGRVVIEILEDACATPAELLEARIRFARLGFGVAVDDFGTGASDQRRVLALAPDYVKLDRSYLAAAAADLHFMDRARRYMASLIDIDIGIVAEGVETPFDVDSADELGAGLMQGFLIDRRTAMRQRNYAEML